ncbi:MAG: PilZ domain-containing protein [Phycisphaerae bacterium]|nr:PilZ domain-containing protein [Phycisphaerae bacterium]MCZ2398701.1 PilZ domain-containing protein [Phycisphaerae bacterium]NUQ49483.1 PilZ domain-containing protein [Phycisphaerae bacterium]
MDIALEMTPRQSGRVLEQAVRGRVAVVIEPRGERAEAPLHGTVDGREGNLLSVRIEQRESELPAGLIGMFCEVRMTASGQHYLFSSCVLDLSDISSPVYLLLAVPSTIHVANRRRFERYSVPTAAQVRLQPAGSSRAQFTALLADVSAEGIACSMSAPKDDDPLLVGENVNVCFELPGYDENFELGGSICNRALTPDKQLLTLGIEFAPAAGTGAQQRTMERLQAVLYEIMNATGTGR